MLCPECSCDREALLELLNSDEEIERKYAWIIAENCTECKEFLNEQVEIQANQKLPDKEQSIETP